MLDYVEIRYLCYSCIERHGAWFRAVAQLGSALRWG